MMKSYEDFKSKMEEIQKKIVEPKKNIRSYEFKKAKNLFKEFWFLTEIMKRPY